MKRAGFTIVELLVTIAIVVSLATVTLTLSRRMLVHARITQSTANLRSLVVANEGYEADHGRYCPADDQSNKRRWHGARSSSDGRFDPARGLLAPYLGRSRRVTVCPLFEAMVPDAGSFESGTGGYGYNAAYIGGQPGGSYDRATKLRISQRRANIRHPGRTVMFATTAYARGAGLQEYPYCEPPFWDFGNGPSGMRPSPTVHFRANGQALVGWCDGHVSAETDNRADAHGDSPHGGDSHAHALGWFGPEQDNGWWNPGR